MAVILMAGFIQIEDLNLWTAEGMRKLPFELN